MISVVASASNSSTAATYNITLPAMLPGDLCLVAYGITNPADSGLGINTAGYTEIANLYANGTTHDTNLAVAYKIMGAVPDTVVNVTGSSSTNRGSSGLAYIIRGIDPASPIDVSTVTATGISSPVPDPPSITPITAGSLLVAIGAGSGVVEDSVGNAPVGYSDLFAVSSAGGIDSIFIAAASKPWVSGADNPSTFTNYNIEAALPLVCSWAAVTLALRPIIAAPDENTRGGFFAYNAPEQPKPTKKKKIKLRLKLPKIEPEPIDIQIMDIETIAPFVPEPINPFIIDNLIALQKQTNDIINLRLAELEDEQNLLQIMFDFMFQPTPG